ncbi:MAG: peptide-methionine (S)-S-oxide reductase MsrA [Alphaproteobacteria bacterium]|nr:peptide-methionine (S)-S-oxide reductase MsrA [Alphaproteobacteria bacterium]
MKHAISTTLIAAMTLISTAATAAESEKIVLAGGCFWGVEAVFESLKGVSSSVSGYAGGTAGSANYKKVSRGSTRHAEAVEVIYNPDIISTEDILKVYFTVAHDPTQLNKQGPDRGPQYRSEIFYTTDTQKTAAKDMIDTLEKSQAYDDPIVTKISALDTFYPAEDYHQDYVQKHPMQPYVVMHDIPKLTKLRKTFPQLCVPK